MQSIREPRGFTLVEILVAMIVLGIVAIGAVNILRIQNESYANQNLGVERTMNARAAVDMMAREMRQAGYDPYGTANAGFDKTKTDEVSWSADLNGDGDTDDFGNGADESVRYFYDKNQAAIVREANGVETVVADNVTSLAFVYLDEDLNSTNSKKKIEQVNIRVTYPTPDGVMDGSMETQVAIRNTIWAGSSGNAGGDDPGSSASSTCDPGDPDCDWTGDGVMDKDDEEAAKLCEDAEKKQEKGLEKRDKGDDKKAEKEFKDSEKECDKATKDYGVTCPVCGDPSSGGWTDEYETVDGSDGSCSLGDVTCDYNGDGSVDKDDEAASELCIEAREKQLKGIDKEEKGDDDKAEKEYEKSAEACQEAEDEYGAACPYCATTTFGNHEGGCSDDGSDDDGDDDDDDDDDDDSGGACDGGSDDDD